MKKAPVKSAPRQRPWQKRPWLVSMATLLALVASAGTAMTVIEARNPIAMRADLEVVAGDLYGGEIAGQQKFILELESAAHEAERVGDRQRALELRQRLIEAQARLEYLRRQQQEYR